MCLYQVVMTFHFLNDVANDAETTKNRKLRHETIGKLINRIPGLRLLISSLPGVAVRTHVDSLSKPHNINGHYQSLACLT